MTLTEWNTQLSHLADFMEVVPLVPFLFLSNEKKREYLLVGIYFAIGFVLKSLSFFIAHGGGNTLFIYHLLAPLEFGLLFAFFTQHSPNYKLRFVIVCLVVTGNLVLSLLPGQLQQFNSMAWSLNTMLLLLACLYSFYSLYARSYKSWEEVRPRFLVISGFLIYLSGCLFTYILGWQILSKALQGFFANGWIINSISNLAKDVIVATGLLAAIKK